MEPTIELPMNFIQELLGNDMFNIVSAVVMLASALSAILPSRVKGNKIGQLVLSLITNLAFNFGKAKNADDVG